ncbi:uncharacterized protein LOC130712693 [Lotus japonicus]|uniref:uncharacterized protein LOC130712693 n=1 Tax=Lotus japonicus TaxID=34305 RepID=UPI002588EFC7|nr:uncharacterized protein LOC130712693 [Lotus japonicus]
MKKILQGNGRSLKEFPCLPYPKFTEAYNFENRFVADELNYNKDEMLKIHEELVCCLTLEQEGVYKNVLNVVLSDNGGFFFLYGFGGTGKTYVWNTLSAALRSRGLIVLNVASSGIASLLLPGGRTVHFRFSIPISINEISTCNLRQGSPKAELLKKASLIIWDEAPMLNKHCFEALDRSLNDIMKTRSIYGYDIPFGGKVVVMKLTVNIRLQNANSSSSSAEMKEFADWLLQVGDGTVTTIREAESLIEIPPDLLIEPCKDPLLEIVNFSYPKLLFNLERNSFFQERAILAPTLESVEEINNFMLAMILGEETEYLSCDTPCKSDEDSGVNAECINKCQAAYWSSNLKDYSVAIRLCCSNIELVAKFNFKSEVIITEHGQQVLLSDHVVDIFVIF